MRLSASVLTLCVLGLICAVGSPARAQTDSVEPPDGYVWCRTATAALRRMPHPRGDVYQKALREVGSCRNLGPVAYAAEWANPPKDSVDLWTLADISGRCRDRRVLAAVTKVAKNASVPRAVRLAAIRPLVRQFNTWIYVHYWVPRYPSSPTTQNVTIGSITGEDDCLGGQPISESERWGVIATLRHLGSSDPDTLIRKISTKLITLIVPWDSAMVAARARRRP